MAVLVPGKFCFLAHPRTGSMAISRALRKVYAGQEIGDHHEGCECDEPTFAVVRDPCEVIQAWQAITAKNTPLLEYARHGTDRWLEQDGRLFWHDADHTLDYTRLQEEFDDLMSKLGHDSVLIPRYNVTSRRKQPITDEVRGAVADRWPADVDLWNLVHGS